MKCVIVLLLITLGGLVAAEAGGHLVPPASTPVESALERACAYLLTQQRADGGIGGDQNITAMTSLAMMSLLGSGHLPTDQDPFGLALQRALAFVLREDRQSNGYFGIADGSRMYGHGIVTLMLAEMVGMAGSAEEDALIRRRLVAAVGLILKSQERKGPNNPDHYGGWRYTPESADSDLSVTIWQLLALRAAKGAGIEVPKVAIDRAVAYLKRCYKVKGEGIGACAYIPGQEPAYATGSAGLLALQLCGEYDAAEVAGSAAWLQGQKIDQNHQWFFYGTYYLAQGLYQVGGDEAERVRRSAVDLLLSLQRPDGSWLAAAGHEAGAGPIYSTSMALLSLTVECHYLPIYQR
jgi:hypothetical protein